MEHRSVARTATIIRSSIEHAARRRQAGEGIRSFAKSEVLQHRVACPVRVQLKYCPTARTATRRCHPIKHAARPRQAAEGIGAIAAGEVLEHGVAGSVCVHAEYRTVA